MLLNNSGLDISYLFYSLQLSPQKLHDNTDAHFKRRTFKFLRWEKSEYKQIRIWIIKLRVHCEGFYRASLLLPGQINTRFCEAIHILTENEFPIAVLWILLPTMWRRDETRRFGSESGPAVLRHSALVSNPPGQVFTTTTILWNQKQLLRRLCVIM